MKRIQRIKTTRERRFVIYNDGEKESVYRMKGNKV
jgi:hypothetical protein